MAERATVRSQQALGEALARLRYDSDLTQHELSDLLGVSHRYVWEMENGKPNLFATRLFELLAELGAHLEVVWPETSQRPAVPAAAASPRTAQKGNPREPDPAGNGGGSQDRAPGRESS